MILKQTIINLINEQDYKGNTKTQPLINAIKKRNTVTFFYSGPIKPKKDSVKRGTRYKAEVMALGLTKKGYMAIRAYVQPPSTSKKGFKKHGWRTFLVTRMSNIQINTDEVFDTKRPGYKEGDDGSFSVTYAKTDWGVKSNPKPVEKPTPLPKTEPTPVLEPTTKVEPSKTELPQPKPVEKPQAEPTPQAEKPEPEELPQPKPEEKPSENPEEKPEDEKDENLMEDIKRIKGLMLLLN
jgi:hypothetical protein